jgi:hypothetical protein
VSHRTAAQLLRRRRVEAVIRLAAPALDAFLYAGDRLSRIVGRGEVAPEPPRVGSDLGRRQLSD